MGSCLTDSDFHRYHAKEMPAPDESRVRAHLEACSSCAERSAKLVAGQEGLIQDLQKAELGEADATVSVGRKKVEPTNRPQQIGAYKILEQLGEGGMGVVYLAEQTEPIRRRVALKLIKLGMDTKQVIARFETERQALALMNHPNVAKVLDAGTTEKGRPYFVMEYVKGESITAYCDRHRLTTKERLELFMQVCQAVQHAHQKGIIHRDIKPSNVLVAAADVAAGAPAGRRKAGAVTAVPKVIDFGVAKATEQKLTERTLFTEQGQLIGTPEYMSPEQAEMTVLDIDTRTDIYSLGVLLYELLVGALPFDPTSLRQAAFAEIQRIIREVEPPKPSTRLSALASEPRAPATGHPPDTGAPATGLSPDTTPPSTDALTPRSRSGLGSAVEIAKRRRTDLSALTKLLRGDLDWITMRAMDKDRTRRYATAAEFADDIARHLNHEPVLASPPSAAYRTSKFIRRNKGPVAIAAVFVLLVSASAVSLGFLYNRAEQNLNLAEQREREANEARDAAQRQLKITKSINDFLNNDLLAAVAPEQQGKDVLMRDVLDAAARNIEGRFAEQPSVEARLRQTIGWVYYSLGQYSQAQEHLERALTLCRAVYGMRTLEEAQTMESLAFVYGMGQLDYRRACDLTRRVLQTRQQLLGPDDALTLRTSGDMAMFEALERGEGAAGLNKLTLGIVAKVRHKGESTEQVREYIMKLLLDVEQQWASGDREGAIARILAENEPLMAVPLLAERLPLAGGAYAMLLYEQGMFPNAAEAIAVASVEFGTTHFGEEHPNTIYAIASLGIMHRDRGRYEEAEPLLVRAFDLCRRVLGEDDQQTLYTMSNLATLYAAQGRYEKAEALFAEALESRRRVFGDDHQTTLSLIKNMGDLLQSMGKHDEAEALLRELLESRRRNRPEGDAAIGSALIALGMNLIEQRRLDEAEPLLRESLKIRQMAFREGHWLIFNTMSVLGESMAGRGADRSLTVAARMEKLREAEALLLEGYEGIKNRPEATDVLPREALERIVHLYGTWHTAEPGKGYDAKAAEWRAKLKQAEADASPD